MNHPILKNKKLLLAWVALLGFTVAVPICLTGQKTPVETYQPLAPAQPKTLPDVARINAAYTQEILEPDFESDWTDDWEDDWEDEPPMQYLSSAEPARNAAPPAIQQSTIKLTLPSLPTEESHLRTVEVDTADAGGFINFNLPDPDDTAFVPAPPRNTAMSEKTTVLLPEFQETNAKIHVTPALTDIMAMAPAAPAPRPPAPEIPGLVTPYQLTAAHDDMDDLVSFDQPAIGVSQQNFDAEQMYDLMSMAAAPPLPEFPTLGDPYVATLEPFAIPPEPAKPQPKPLAVPAPIVTAQKSFHSRPPSAVQRELLPIPAVSLVKHHTPPASPLPQPQQQLMAMVAPSGSLRPAARAKIAPVLPPVAAPKRAEPVVMEEPEEEPEQKTSILHVTSSLLPPTRKSQPKPSPAPTAKPEKSDLQITKTPPQNNSDSTGPSSGPLLLPIGPLVNQQPAGAPLLGNLAAGGTIPAPPSVGKTRPLIQDDPMPRPMRSSAFLSDGPMPAALTPEEFALLEAQGFSESMRPTGTRGTPAVAPDPIPVKTPLSKKPSKIAARPSGKSRKAKETPAPARKERKLEGFTNMRDSGSVIGPPDPRLFSTKSRW